MNNIRCLAIYKYFLTQYDLSTWMFLNSRYDAFNISFQFPLFLVHSGSVALLKAVGQTSDITQRTTPQGAVRDDLLEYFGKRSKVVSGSTQGEGRKRPSVCCVNTRPQSHPLCGRKCATCGKLPVTLFLSAPHDFTRGKSNSKTAGPHQVKGGVSAPVPPRPPLTVLATHEQQTWLLRHLRPAGEA